MKNINPFSLSQIILFILLFYHIDINSQCQSTSCPTYDPLLYANIPTVINLNIQTDFGAVGDGITDDHEAFHCAASFINQRGGYVNLHIPDGTYIVGRQFEDCPDNTTNNPILNAWVGERVFGLKDCTKVKILGNNNSTPTIKFKDDLYFGTFNPITNEPTNKNPGTTPYFEVAEKATIKELFHFNNCNQIKVQNLDLDGNLIEDHLSTWSCDRPNDSRNYTRGGFYGNTDGIQLNHIGISIFECDNIVVNKVKAENFGVDGFHIWNELDNTNIRFKDCVASRNARQGLSLVGGKNMKFTNCLFTLSGKGDYKSFTGNGIDIEAHNSTLTIEDIDFISCQFTNNFGFGLLIARTNQIVRNINFEECEFISDLNTHVYSSYSAAIYEGEELSFSNCNFYGDFLNYTNPDLPKTDSDDVPPVDERVPIMANNECAKLHSNVFLNCDFSDQYYDSSNQNYLNVGRKYYTADVNFSANNLFSHCNFDFYDSHGMYIASAYSKKNRSSIRHSNFEVYTRSGWRERSIIRNIHLCDNEFNACAGFFEVRTNGVNDYQPQNGNTYNNDPSYCAPNCQANINNHTSATENQFPYTGTKYNLPTTITFNYVLTTDPDCYWELDPTSPNLVGCSLGDGNIDICIDVNSKRPANVSWGLNGIPNLQVDNAVKGKRASCFTLPSLNVTDVYDVYIDYVHSTYCDESYNFNACTLTLIPDDDHASFQTLGNNDSDHTFMTINDLSSKDFIKNNSLKVFPNPITQQVNLTYISPMHENAKIAIYNTSGVQVLSFTDIVFTTGENNTTLDIEVLPAGTYFIKLISKQSNQIVKVNKF